MPGLTGNARTQNQKSAKYDRFTQWRQGLAPSSFDKVRTGSGRELSVEEVDPTASQEVVIPAKDSVCTGLTDNGT
jgi:hypothetical protein